MSKSIEITNAPGQTLDIEEFQDEIRNAVLIPGSPPASPPHLPPDFMIDLPLIHLRVPPADACRYLRAAFRLWVTELRPLWRPSTLGENPCCADKKDGDPTDKDCVLLARLDVPVIEDTLTGELLIDATEDVRRDEETRPFLAHLRFLQEWLLCGAQAEAAGKVVAAGRFDAQGNSVPAPLFSFNLQAQRLGNAALNLFLLRFNSFDSKRGYVVKGTPLASGNAQPVSFEVIPSNDALVLPFGREAQGGIIVRVRQSNGQPAQGFMVEISQF